LAGKRTEITKLLSLSLSGGRKKRFSEFSIRHRLQFVRNWQDRRPLHHAMANYQRRLEDLPNSNKFLSPDARTFSVCLLHLVRLTFIALTFIAHCPTQLQKL